MNIPNLKLSVWVIVAVFITLSTNLYGKNLISRNYKVRQTTCSIQFNPRGYMGTYFVDNAVNANTGSVKLNLKPTRPGEFHTLEIGGRGDGNSQIQFGVTNNCKVTGTSGSVVFSNNFVTFKNISIEIDPDDFGGLFYIKGDKTGAAGTRGNTLFTVVPLIPNFVEVYGQGMGSLINFSVDTRGKITLPQGSINSATVEGNRLIFRTRLITVDPKAFTGSYQIGEVTGNVGKQLDVVTVLNLPIKIFITLAKPRTIIPRFSCLQVDSDPCNRPPANFDVLDSANRKNPFTVEMIPGMDP